MLAIDSKCDEIIIVSNYPGVEAVLSIVDCNRWHPLGLMISHAAISPAVSIWLLLATSSLQLVLLCVENPI